MTILVVDNEAEIAEFFMNSLNESGYRARACKSGYEAMDLIEKGSIRCVVTDYFMPEGDGISLSHFCANRGIPCVVVTGMVTESVQPYIPEGTPVIAKTYAIQLSKIAEVVTGHLAAHAKRIKAS